LDAEIAAADADLVVQRREMAAPVPARDLSLAGALSEAERALSEALEELGAMRAASQAQGEALAALRRVEAARSAELETVRRRLGEAGRTAADERAAADEAARKLAEAESACAAPRAAGVAAAESEKTAVAAREKARVELDSLEGARQAAAERAASTAAKAASLRGRHESVQARLAEEETRGISKAARKLGGKPLADGLEVEAGFRVSVEAALGEAMRGYVMGRDGALGLDGQRGTLVLDVDGQGGAGGGSAAGGAAGSGSSSGAGAAHGAAGAALAGSGTATATGREAARAAERAAEAGDAAVSVAASHGGGKLSDAIRVDPNGAALRLLARAVWLPDLAAALAVQPRLPMGWIAATKDGAVVTAAGVVTMGRSESLLDRRAEMERLGEEVARLAADSARAAADSAAATKAAATARAALEAARETERKAGAARREAEDAERRATRALETVAREAAWRTAQAARLEADRERLADAVRLAEAGDAAAADGNDKAAPGATPQDTERANAIREWEARAAALRARRDQLAAEEATLEAARREVESRRARAGAAAEFDQSRIGQVERQITELAERERSLAAERESLGEELAAATLREAAVRAELDEIRSAEAVARAQLAEAESAAGQARERLRSCQERVRNAEVAELESRLALDSIREQVLVELAGLGDMGLRLLGSDGDEDDDEAPLPAAARPARGAAPDRDGDEATDDADSDEPDASALEEALTAAAARWTASPVVEPPGAGKLAQLRRRFHELGAPNPFAAEEYQTVRTRLEGLETQRADLLEAIAKTRQLIEQLNGMISTQFRETFHALETAFDSRFRQLFGGGFARLSLTDPEDLTATGIEITARPPGKKAQPLSMLSGGERTLTAVALLFAMLQVHPVPFCVLDEVDAALDEANVGRFAEALRSLADQTQFVVITHNRGTIESADALYGVTVGDDAVSRVISLRLEEAKELADQVTRKAAAAG
jgi:chromosome segregation protein